MTTRFYNKGEIEKISGMRINLKNCFLPGGRSFNGIEINFDVYSELSRQNARNPLDGPEEDLAPCVTVVLDDGTRFQGVCSDGTDLSLYDSPRNKHYSVPIGHNMIVALALEGR